MKKIICLLLTALCLTACASEAAPVGSTQAVTEAAAETTVPVDTAPAAPTGLTFSTVTMDGEPVTQELFAGYKLILLNFWEPWCGPCVGEMPDLEKIYQAFRDKGLLIVGVNYTQDGAADVVKQTGVTYPLLQYVEEFYPLTTAYVPTTVFLNAAGEVITIPQAGSRSYEDFAKWIEQLLTAE